MSIRPLSLASLYNSWSLIWLFNSSTVCPLSSACSFICSSSNFLACSSSFSVGDLPFLIGGAWAGGAWAGGAWARGGVGGAWSGDFVTFPVLSNSSIWSKNGSFNILSKDLSNRSASAWASSRFLDAISSSLLPSAIIGFVGIFFALSAASLSRFFRASGVLYCFISSKSSWLLFISNLPRSWMISIPSFPKVDSSDCCWFDCSDCRFASSNCRFASSWFKLGDLPFSIGGAWIDSWGGPNGLDPSTFEDLLLGVDWSSIWGLSENGCWEIGPRGTPPVWPPEPLLWRSNSLKASNAVFNTLPSGTPNFSAALANVASTLSNSLLLAVVWRSDFEFSYSPVMFLFPVKYLLSKAFFPNSAIKSVLFTIIGE